ncbi:unnamed protein product [Closterium sp. NIES-54]
MDAEMASWKSTGTYVDEVPPPGANIVSGMWIFRVKRPPGSPPAFKARYVARGFSQRQGVDFFQTFSPTPKMTTLLVLLHVAAQRDYELHSLDFSTTFLRAACTRRSGYAAHLASLGRFLLWHDTLRTTLAALGFSPSTADPSLFLRTDATMPPFYVLVYVDDLVFATADTEFDANGNIERYKSRLVAKGYQQKEKVDYKELFAPVVKLTTLRTLLAGATIKGWVVKQMDVTTAFLNGVLEEEIFMAQPEGFDDGSGIVLRLKKALYGLKQAPRQWYLKLRGVLEEIGFTPSTADHSLFMLGEGERGVSWLYVAFATGQLARVVQCPNEEQVAAGMRVAKYLGQTPTVGLQYSAAAQRRQKGADGVEPGRLFLTAFSDASYASEPEDMTSVGGFICCVGGGPTAWESKKQVDQALSSVESEYMALFRAVREIVWQRRLLAELGEEQQGPTPLYCDSQGAIALAKNPVLLSFMVVYVDDILIFSPSSDLVKEVMLKLQDKFKCKALGDVSFYLGLHIERDVEKRCMRVHQRKYLEALAANFGQSEGHVATPFSSCFKCVKGPEEESVGEEERHRFHSLVGSLMYAAVNTRPEVAFATGQLARVVQCPNEEVAAGMRVAKYLGQTLTVGLHYSAAAQRRQKGADGVDPRRLFLTAFSDASYASEPEDMKSVGGFICCVGGGPTA